MPESTSLGGTVIAVSVSLTFLSAVFLGLRLYCKIVRHRGFWWDDHVLIAAWVSFLKQPASLISHLHPAVFLYHVARVTLTLTTCLQHTQYVIDPSQLTCFPSLPGLPLDLYLPRHFRRQPWFWQGYIRC
jgi:hypothetical protein